MNCIQAEENAQAALEEHSRSSIFVGGSETIDATSSCHGIVNLQVELLQDSVTPVTKKTLETCATQQEDDNLKDTSESSMDVDDLLDTLLAEEDSTEECQPTVLLQDDLKVSTWDASNPSISSVEQSLVELEQECLHPNQEFEKERFWSMYKNERALTARRNKELIDALVRLHHEEMEALRLKLELTQTAAAQQEKKATHTKQPSHIPVTVHILSNDCDSVTDTTSTASTRSTTAESPNQSSLHTTIRQMRNKLKQNSQTTTNYSESELVAECKELQARLLQTDEHREQVLEQQQRIFQLEQTVREREVEITDLLCRMECLESTSTPKHKKTDTTLKAIKALRSLQQKDKIKMQKLAQDRDDLYQSLKAEQASKRALQQTRDQLQAQHESQQTIVADQKQEIHELTQELAALKENKQLEYEKQVAERKALEQTCQELRSTIAVRRLEVEDLEDQRSILIEASNEQKHRIRQLEKQLNQAKPDNTASFSNDCFQEIQDLKRERDSLLLAAEAESACNARQQQEVNALRQTIEANETLCKERQEQNRKLMEENQQLKKQYEESQAMLLLQKGDVEKCGSLETALLGELEELKSLEEIVEHVMTKHAQEQQSLRAEFQLEQNRLQHENRIAKKKAKVLERELLELREQHNRLTRESTMVQEELSSANESIGAEFRELHESFQNLQARMEEGNRSYEETIAEQANRYKTLEAKLEEVKRAYETLKRATLVVNDAAAESDDPQTGVEGSSGGEATAELESPPESEKVEFLHLALNAAKVELSRARQERSDILAACESEKSQLANDYRSQVESLELSIAELENKNAVLASDRDRVIKELTEEKERIISKHCDAMAKVLEFSDEQNRHLTNEQKRRSETPNSDAQETVSPPSGESGSQWWRLNDLRKVTNL